jgi:TolB-like protein/Tfp pilus assembly protein PilF
LRYQSAHELRLDLERMSPPTMPALRQRRRGGAVRALLVGAVPLVLVAVALLLLPGDCRDRLVRGVQSGPIAALAVLPLENLSRDPEQEYFADGLTDELITELTKIGALRVIAASSVQGFRDPRISLADIARRLNVGALVVGSVLRAGDRVRINARLVQARDARQLWAESYERGLRDILGLQSEVALDIAHGVQARLTPGERHGFSGKSPVNPAAYEDYLKGRFFLKRASEQDLETAHQYFKRAIAEDPSCARAYAGIADRYYEASSIWMSPREAIPEARTAALKALELDSTLAEAHTSLGTVEAVFDWDWKGSEREFRRAIELNPGYGLAHQRYGYVLGMLGKHAEAIDQERRAVDLDPLSTYTSTSLAVEYLFARRYDDAISECRRTIAMDTTFYLPRVFYGLTLAGAGRLAEAIPQLELATRMSDNLQGLAQKGSIYARAGRRADALAVLDVLARRTRATATYYPDYDVAALYAALGDRDEAFVHLERAFAAKSEALLWLMNDWRLDPLRTDPRFASLRRRLRINSS